MSQPEKSEASRCPDPTCLECAVEFGHPLKFCPLCNEKEPCECEVQSSKPAQDGALRMTLHEYLESRVRTIEASIAAEELADNIVKLQAEKTALAEIHALQAASIHFRAASEPREVLAWLVEQGDWSCLINRENVAEFYKAKGYTVKPLGEIK